MTRMLLTASSEEQLEGRDNASGVVFIRTGDKEITSFEFYRRRNGQLYVTDARKPLKVATELEWLSKQIPEDE